MLLHFSANPLPHRACSLSRQDGEGMRQRTKICKQGHWWDGDTGLSAEMGEARLDRSVEEEGVLLLPFHGLREGRGGV